MSLDRATRWLLESRMTSATALKWAQAYRRTHGRWPTRRYRVMAFVGTSRFLTWAGANATQGKYGGKIEEIIPTMTAYLATLGITRMSKHDVEAEGLGRCPRCQAEPGRACREPRGTRRSPHCLRMPQRRKGQPS